MMQSPESKPTTADLLQMPDRIVRRHIQSTLLTGISFVMVLCSLSWSGYELNSTTSKVQALDAKAKANEILIQNQTAKLADLGSQVKVRSDALSQVPRTALVTLSAGSIHTTRARLPVIYIQIRDSSQLPEANDLRKALAAANFVAPAAEVVQNRPFASSPQIRFSNQANTAWADQVSTIVKSTLDIDATQMFKSGLRISPNVCEVWLPGKVAKPVPQGEQPR